MQSKGCLSLGRMVSLNCNNKIQSLLEPEATHLAPPCGQNYQKMQIRKYFLIGRGRGGGGVIVIGT